MHSQDSYKTPGRISAWFGRLDNLYLACRALSFWYKARDRYWGLCKRSLQKRQLQCFALYLVFKHLLETRNCALWGRSKILYKYYKWESIAVNGFSSFSILNSWLHEGLLEYMYGRLISLKLFPVKHKRIELTVSWANPQKTKYANVKQVMSVLRTEQTSPSHGETCVENGSGVSNPNKRHIESS